VVERVGGGGDSFGNSVSLCYARIYGFGYAM